MQEMSKHKILFSLNIGYVTLECLEIVKPEYRFCLVASRASVFWCFFLTLYKLSSKELKAHSQGIKESIIAFEKSETNHKSKGCIRTQSIDCIFKENWL